MATGKTPDGTTYDKGYVDSIVDRFNQSQYNLKVKNYGVSGYKTTNIIDDFNNPENVELQKSIEKAKLVTIDIGANDLLAQLGMPLFQQKK
jgi:lysophospholipase L1-like esterase